MNSRGASRSKREIAASIMTSTVLFVAAVAFVFPILWTLLMSVKQTVDALAMPPRFLFKPTFEHYLAVWGDGRFLRFGANSLLVAACATVIGLALAAPAAYVFAKHRRPGYKYLMFGVLSTRMIPQVTFMIPFFIVFRALHLIDTYPALILMHLTIILGFVIWLMRSYFAEIPIELEEAALADGCTYFQAFRKVMLPVAAPGLATSAIFSFIYSWNEFLYALIVTGTNTKTIPIGVYNWVAWQEVHWGELTASAILALIPVLTVYFFVQKQLVRGLTMGALKG